MPWRVFAQLKPTKEHFGFLVTVLVVIGLFCLAFFKGVDTQMSIVSALGLFLGARSAEKIGMVSSAAKDPSADTAQVINRLEGHKVDSPD